MYTAPFCPYAVPSLIPDKVIPHGWLFFRMTFSFPYFLPFSLHWVIILLCLIWPWPNFQQFPLLRVVPYVEYLCVSIPWSLRKISQTGPLVGILWINLQACALCFSMIFTCCCFEPGPSQWNNLYRCAYMYHFMTSSCYFPFLFHSGCIVIRCSVKCHIRAIPWTKISRYFLVDNHLLQLIRPQWRFCVYFLIDGLSMCHPVFKVHPTTSVDILVRV